MPFEETSHLRKAITGASWLGISKLVSQLVSWTFTILVTRILSSRDYGLMEMATVFTGYLAFFVEFGMGAALVNRTNVSKEENSSVFWILFFWGSILFLLAYLLGPVTANFYQEPELTKLTQFAGILFLLSSLIIVPRTILQRELRFKELGFIEALCTISSCLVMYYLATNNFGYWTLIYGYVFREVLSTACIAIKSKFYPLLHFDIRDIKPLISFGLPVVLSSSLYYIYTKSDRFFGGQTLGPVELGFYAVSLQLAAIPVEKIGSVVQSVLYPLLSKVKDDKKIFSEYYLSFISLLSIITVPLFVGGFVLAEPLIFNLLGEKWLSSVIPFKLLLIGQLIMILSAPNALINNARGEPKVNFYFNCILCPSIMLGFYLSASMKELNYLALPWIVIYPLFQLFFTKYTLNKVSLSLLDLLKMISPSLLSSFNMALVLEALIFLCYKNNYNLHTITELLTLSIIGALVYVGYFLIFDYSSIRKIIALFKGEKFEPLQNN